MLALWVGIKTPMPWADEYALSLEIDSLLVIQNLSCPLQTPSRWRQFLTQQSKVIEFKGERTHLWEDPSAGDLAPFFCRIYCCILHACVYNLRIFASVSLSYTTQLELKYAFMRWPGYIYSLMSQIAHFPKDGSFERNIQYTFSSQLNIFEIAL